MYFFSENRLRVLKNRIIEKTQMYVLPRKDVPLPTEPLETRGRGLDYGGREKTDPTRKKKAHPKFPS